MLTVRIASKDTEQTAAWFIEPYGDDVTLAGGDVLQVDVADGPDVRVEITRHAHGTSLWLFVGGDVVVPTALRLNDRSVWPE